MGGGGFLVVEITERWERVLNIKFVGYRLSSERAQSYDKGNKFT